MKFVNIDNVEDGTVLARNVFSDNNRDLLLIAGTTLTQTKIERLKKIGICGIFVEDTWSEDIVIKETVSSSLIQTSLASLSDFNVDKICECASAIVDSLISSESYTHDLASIRSHDEYTYEHCVNVAIHSVTMGIGMGYEHERLLNLAVGAMLHDLGKNAVPEEILNKKSKLSKQEFEIIKKHPEAGYQLLKDKHDISSSSRAIVYEHHENWDGSGYPRGLAGSQIYELAMVVHICDIYDALISKRAYKQEFPVHEVIKLLREGADRQYTSEILSAFFKYVPVYYKGTEVELSSGDLALVYENNRGDMLHPKVKLRNGSILDLRKESIISITS